MNRIFYDTEQNEIISEEQLFAEYLELKASNDTEAETFEIYVCNCTDKNGTLELI